MRRSIATLPGHWLTSPVREGISRRTIVLLTLGTAAVIWFATAAGAGGTLGLVTVLAVVGIAIWRRPFVGLMLLIILGTAHQIGMLLVFQVVGGGAPLRAAQTWKEVVVLLLLAKCVHLTLRRRAAPRVRLLDLTILMYLVLATLYLAYPSSVEETTFTSMVFGLRANVFFLLTYFIGRALPITMRQVRIMLVTMACLVAVNAVLGSLQVALPGLSNTFVESLGYRDYIAIQRGDSDGIFAVRQNYVSGAVLTRASSILLSDLGLAFFTLLAAPLVLARFMGERRVIPALVANGLALAALGTILLTVTRTAILAIIPAVVAMTVASRNYRALGLVLIQLAIITVPIAYTLDITPSLLRDIWSPNEASARGHLAAYEQSLEIIRAQPFGRGLGTSGTIAQRFVGAGGITNESWYLQIATEIGVFAAVLFALIIVLAVGTSFVAYARAPNPELRILSLGMAGAAIGFGFASITLHAWDGQTTSIIFWLFMGLVARTDAHRNLA